MNPRIFQVNQNNREETAAGILCAPDDSRGGHNLIRQFRPGDILFHYNSKHPGGGRTHALSVVEPFDLADGRLARWRRDITPGERGQCFLAYSGSHFTQEQPSGRTQFLLAFSRPLRAGLDLPNAFPGRMIYLREIEIPGAAHAAAVEELQRRAILRR